MVYFTCNNCGESLKKPQVAKHYQFKCRNPASLTCVDCLKDFWADEYVAHTKCITENERYGGKDYVPKPGTNKGEKKQQDWINIVQNLLTTSNNLSKAERDMLNTMSKYENIPRKKAKFLNFIKNVFGNRTNMAVVESIWAKMEEAFKEAVGSTKNGQKENNEGKSDKAHTVDPGENNVAENQNNENLSRENGDSTQEEKKKKKKRKNEPEYNNSTEVTSIQEDKTKTNSKKRKLSESENNEEDNFTAKRKNGDSNKKLDSSILIEQNGVSDNIKFNWKGTILEIVSTKGEISLKKLKKKVVGLYIAQSSDTVTTEKAELKFNKKLNKLSQVVVSEEKVRLAQL
ncbi:cell growth-regulating nucleolar protein [Cephus cinctus]|uniref:Cell growth-regulating nucleolar protein n=1 Tax=Cephus cinctus TaxID=211228 RepID=A0AAJ7C3L0_CEPCN|nr:cell growth-regulating nucleolar protein [Cephus cinctus]